MVVAQATEAMKTVNTIASPADTMKTIQAFELENDKMALKDESWDEMMDLFDGDGVAEESDNVVNQIMDELGLQMGSSMPVHPNTVFRSAASIDAEVEYYSDLHSYRTLCYYLYLYRWMHIYLQFLHYQQGAHQAVI